MMYTVFDQKLCFGLSKCHIQSPSVKIPFSMRSLEAATNREHPLLVCVRYTKRNTMLNILIKGILNPKDQECHPHTAVSLGWLNYFEIDI